MPAPDPMLSILLVTDSMARLRKVLRCYRAQTDPTRLEIVIAALEGAEVALESVHVLGFTHARIVAVGGTDATLAEEQAVRAATAPFVLFTHAHAYPRPGCVEAILAAQRSGRWVMIGPAMANANPDTVVSWAAMHNHYGQWSDQRRRGPATKLPGHYCAYDRQALLALGSELRPLLGAGAALQVALQARGGELFFEPAACVEIVNISRLGWYLVDQFCESWKFAARRQRRWSLVRRLSHLGGTPLIPLVRLRRILAHLRRAHRLHEAWRGLPLLLIGLTASAAGELMGYAFGADVPASLSDTSLDRLRYVRPQDRARELDESAWPGEPTLENRAK